MSKKKLQKFTFERSPLGSELASLSLYAFHERYASEIKYGDSRYDMKTLVQIIFKKDTYDIKNKLCKEKHMQINGKDT